MALREILKTTGLIVENPLKEEIRAAALTDNANALLELAFDERLRYVSERDRYLIAKRALLAGVDILGKNLARKKFEPIDQEIQLATSFLVAAAELQTENDPYQLRAVLLEADKVLVKSLQFAVIDMIEPHRAPLDLTLVKESGGELEQMARRKRQQGFGDRSLTLRLLTDHIFGFRVLKELMERRKQDEEEPKPARWTTADRSYWILPRARRNRNGFYPKNFDPYGSFSKWGGRIVACVLEAMEELRFARRVLSSNHSYSLDAVAGSVSVIANNLDGIVDCWSYSNPGHFLGGPQGLEIIFLYFRHLAQLTSTAFKDKTRLSEGNLTKQGVDLIKSGLKIMARDELQRWLVDFSKHGISEKHFKRIWTDWQEISIWLNESLASVHNFGDKKLTRQFFPWQAKKADSLSAGEVLNLSDGRYRIIEADGHICKALTPHAERPMVALRFDRDRNPKKLREQKALLERIRQQAPGEIKPLIPQVYDILVDGQDHCYLSGEWIEGIDLESFLRQRGGKLEEKEVRQIVLDIALILDYLSSLKSPIVHRDVKPSNIMIRPVQEGSVSKVRMVLIDWDLAGSEGEYLDRKGTEVYMAPEQRAAMKADQKPMATHFSDVYALGMMIYELLTGDSPKGANYYGEPEIRFPKLKEIRNQMWQEIILGCTQLLTPRWTAKQVIDRILRGGMFT